MPGYWNSEQPGPRWEMPSLNSGGAGQIAIEIARQREAQRQQAAQAVASMSQGLMKAYQGYKADKVADSLLQQRDPQAAAQYKAAGLSGQQAWGQYQQDYKQDRAQEAQAQTQAQTQQSYDRQANREDVKDWYSNQINNRKLWPEKYGMTDGSDDSGGQKIWTDEVSGRRYVVGEQGGLHPLGGNSTARNSTNLTPVARGWTVDGKFSNDPAKSGHPKENAGAAGDTMQVTNPAGKTFTMPYAAWEARTAKPSEAMNPVSVKEGNAPTVATVPKEEKKPVSNVHKVTSDKDFDAVPSGEYFIGPDGLKRRKP